MQIRPQNVFNFPRDEARAFPPLKDVSNHGRIRADAVSAAPTQKTTACVSSITVLVAH